MNIVKKFLVIGVDFGYQVQKFKNEVVVMIGFVDFIEFFFFQWYCGGLYIIMYLFRCFFKIMGFYFNQYVVICEDSDVVVMFLCREFIVLCDNNLKCYMKFKFFVIGQVNIREFFFFLEYINEFNEWLLSVLVIFLVGYR